MDFPTFYLVRCRLNRVAFVAEADLSGADIETTVRDIALGEYPGEVTAVYRVDRARGVTTDETVEVFGLVVRYLEDARTSPCESVSRALYAAGIDCPAHLMTAEW